MKEVCSICGRVRAGIENEHDNRITHSLCARCILGYEGATLVPLEQLIDKTKKDDPKIQDALEYVRDAISEELQSGIRWIGEGIKYPEDAERFYQELLTEAGSEIDREARNEIKMR